MANHSSSRPSFSLRQQWSIFFSVIVSIAAMSAVIIMLNYLGARYYLRFPWSIQTRQELSSQTINVLKSVTNEINIIIFYDKKDRLYDNIKNLLEDYRHINPKISVKTVDYLVDAGDARKIEETYRDYMGAGADTNLVIFSSSNGTNVVHGEELGDFKIEPVASEDGREYRNKLEYFEGEKWFTAKIFSLVNGKPSRAYFLEGLASPHPLDGQGLSGYQKFKSVLQANNVDATNVFSLTGSNGIPADCKLLVLAGPGNLSRSEIENIRRYLDQGGRLFVLFNSLTLEANPRAGLESLLAEWGVAVGRNTVKDLKNHYGDSDNNVVIKSFNRTHPVVSHLQGLPLALFLPRSVGTNSVNQGPDASSAQELAWTGNSATINDSPVITGKPVPLMVAVEKGEVKGITDRGPTRIIVVGDSYFLGNEMIDTARNHAFAGYAVNWLLGQTQMLQGVGSQHIHEYTLKMTPAEEQNIRWIFLAAMPGCILLLGGLVWLRRRH